MRRMDRYNDLFNTKHISRTSQNKDLYENVGNNAKYASLTDITTSNTIDLSNTKNSKTREGYHQMKEYQDVVPIPRVKKELDDFNHFYQEHENRVYDINNVLEEARKNRHEKDDLEEKRKLKNTSYNILASLNPEELEKYRQERLDRHKAQDEDELRELIDTMTSATLAGDIKVASELLSDLMATSIMDRVGKPESESKILPSTDNRDENNLTKDKNDSVEKTTNEYKLDLSQEMLDLEKLKKLDELSKETPSKESSQLVGADEDFYTRSMDLSDSDFETDESFKERQTPIGIKILIFLITLIVIAAVFYFIWKKI